MLLRVAAGFDLSFLAFIVSYFNFCRITAPQCTSWLIECSSSLLCPPLLPLSRTDIVCLTLRRHAHKSQTHVTCRVHMTLCYFIIVLTSSLIHITLINDNMKSLIISTIRNHIRSYFYVCSNDTRILTVSLISLCL